MYFPPSTRPCARVGPGIGQGYFRATAFNAFENDLKTTIPHKNRITT